MDSAPYAMSSQHVPSKRYYSESTHLNTIINSTPASCQSSKRPNTNAIPLQSIMLHHPQTSPPQGPTCSPSQIPQQHTMIRPPQLINGVIASSAAQCGGPNLYGCSPMVTPMSSNYPVLMIGQQNGPHSVPRLVAMGDDQRVYNQVRLTSSAPRPMSFGAGSPAPQQFTRTSTPGTTSANQMIESAPNRIAEIPEHPMVQVMPSPTTTAPPFSTVMQHRTPPFDQPNTPLNDALKNKTNNLIPRHASREVDYSKRDASHHGEPSGTTVLPKVVRSQEEIPPRKMNLVKDQSLAHQSQLAPSTSPHRVNHHYSESKRAPSPAATTAVPETNRIHPSGGNPSSRNPSNGNPSGENPSGGRYSGGNPSGGHPSFNSSSENLGCHSQLVLQGQHDLKEITREYEALLIAERQVHESSLREKEEEIRSLMRHTHQLELLVNGKSDHVNVYSLLRTREDELRMLFKGREQHMDLLEKRIEVEERLRRQLHAAIQEARSTFEPNLQEEIQRLKRLLDHRQSQLKQAEVVASTRQEQYQAALRDLAVKETLIQAYKPLHPEDARLQASAHQTAHQLDYLESEVTAMRQIVDELAFDKSELQNLLIQKDKQLACMSGLDPTMNETSAVQLSVQAISMVQSTMELKDQIRSLEAEVLGLRQRCQECNEKADEDHEKLTEKRQECAALIETLATRDMKLARLHTLSQHRDKELNQVKEDSRVALAREREKSVRLEVEVRIAIDQQSRLREELGHRTDSSLDLKNEIIRQSNFNHESENRVKILSNELKQAQKHLSRLIKQNVAKDAYMLELEKRMKDNDVKRQATYLNEVAKTRKLQLDIRLREDDARYALHDREEEIANLRTELVTSNKQVDAVRNLLLLTTESNGLHTRSLTTDEILPSNGVMMLTGCENSRQESTKFRRRSHTADDFPHDDDPVSIGEQHRRTFRSAEHRRHKKIVQYKQRPDRGHSKLQAIDEMQNIKQSPRGDSHHGEETNESDLVDFVLRETLQKAGYRSIRPMFCRLGRGSYLFGSHKVALRVSSKGHLEGQTDLNVAVWVPFPSFVTAMKARMAAYPTTTNS